MSWPSCTTGARSKGTPSTAWPAWPSRSRARSTCCGLSVGPGSLSRSRRGRCRPRSGPADGRADGDLLDRRDVESLAGLPQGLGGLPWVLHVRPEEAVRAGTIGGVPFVVGDVQLALSPTGARARVHPLVVRLLPRRGRRLAADGVGHHQGHAAPDLPDPHEAPRADRRHSRQAEAEEYPMTSTAMPPTVELCARLREGKPCLGRVYRGQPDEPYCRQCGATAAGVMYQLAEELAP